MVRSVPEKLSGFGEVQNKLSVISTEILCKCIGGDRAHEICTVNPKIWIKNVHIKPVHLYYAVINFKHCVKLNTLRAIYISVMTATYMYNPTQQGISGLGK